MWQVPAVALSVGKLIFWQIIGCIFCTEEHSLQVPFLLYLPSFCLNFLVHNILKCSNLFFSLEWILGSTVVRENMMRIMCGSVSLRSESINAKKEAFSLVTLCLGEQPYCTSLFSISAIAWEYFPNCLKRFTRLFRNYPVFTSSTLSLFFLSLFLSLSFSFLAIVKYLHFLQKPGFLLLLESRSSYHIPFIRIPFPHYIIWLAPI